MRAYDRAGSARDRGTPCEETCENVENAIDLIFATQARVAAILTALRPEPQQTRATSELQ
jgi:hypothetical protein